MNHAEPIPFEEIHVLDRTVRLLHAAKGGFRTSLDTVLLAAACAIAPGESLLDAGCGVGGAGLCVLRRVPDITLTGVDIQPDSILLARNNAQLNGFADAAFFEEADIRAYAAQFVKPVFDHVICNPPYMEAGTYTASPDAPRAMALGHKDDDMALADWVVAAHKCLKSKGSLTLIHRADAVADILAALGPRFGDITLIPLWPKHGEPAKRIIVRAYKDRKGRPALLPGLVLHAEDGAYTAQAEAILRLGNAI